MNLTAEGRERSSRFEEEDDDDDEDEDEDEDKGEEEAASALVLRHKTPVTSDNQTPLRRYASSACVGEEVEEEEEEEEVEEEEEEEEEENNSNEDSKFFRRDVMSKDRNMPVGLPHDDTYQHWSSCIAIKCSAGHSKYTLHPSLPSTSGRIEFLVDTTSSLTLFGFSS